MRQFSFIVLMATDTLRYILEFLTKINFSQGNVFYVYKLYQKATFGVYIASVGTAERLQTLENVFMEIACLLLILYTSNNIAAAHM